MKPTLRYGTSLARALLVLFAGAAIGFSAQTQSPSFFATKAVREALKERGVEPEMKVIPRASRELRRVISRNLDPRLLTQTQSVCGRDFQYHFAESSRTAYLGVIVLRYRAVAMAQRMAAVLVLRQKYFKNSKILTRFAAISLGNLLVVTYSENGGDDRIVEALNNLPTRFEKASMTKGMLWDESETVKSSSFTSAIR